MREHKGEEGEEREKGEKGEEGGEENNYKLIYLFCRMYTTCSAKPLCCATLPCGHPCLSKCGMQCPPWKQKRKTIKE